MRAAPAFEVAFGVSATERSLLALLGGTVSAALGAWAWSHGVAAAGLDGRWLWPWLLVVPAAGILGAWIAWRTAPGGRGMLRWQQGQWALGEATSGAWHEGALVPKLDLGSWLLLRFRSHGGKVRWVTISNTRAGPAWHPLRATLFAPGNSAVEPPTGESAPT